MTVDDCLTLDVALFRDDLREQENKAGHLSWGHELELNYKLFGRYLYLSGIKQERLELEPTVLASGGKRWWLVCPICGGRVTKLYLPTLAGQFACRVCYDLGYSN